MESFLSILSVQTNSYSNENVVVGLLAVSGNSLYFDFSKAKINLAQKISGSNQSGMLTQNLLKKIENQVSKENNPQTKFFSKSLFNASYFEYLNDYSGGALKFSEPVHINKVFDNESFASYYHKFVGEITTKKTIAKTFKSSVKKYFEKEGLNEKADIAYKLNPEKFNGIYSETTVPLITKNGTVTAVQLIDFESSKDVCANNLYVAKSIYYGLSDFCAKKLSVGMNKMKIVCKEPDLTSESHKVFELANKESADIFDFIHPQELNAYTDQILNSNNVTFSSLVEKV